MEHGIPEENRVIDRNNEDSRKRMKTTGLQVHEDLSPDCPVGWRRTRRIEQVVTLHISRFQACEKQG